MFDLDPLEVTTLITIASKACEFKVPFLIGMHSQERAVEASQVNAVILTTSRLLAHLDEKYPGIVPVPHDGVQWKDRVE